MLEFHHSVLLSIAASVVWLNVRSESESGIRLVGGPDTVPNAGRVEVWSPDVSKWIAVCDSEWGFKDAQVVCRELGYTGTGQQRSFFGDGSISNSSVVQYNCFGTEPSLSRCPKTVAETCPSSGNTLGVVCKGPGYVGCYQDNRGDTFHDKNTSSSMTIEMCFSIARARTAGSMSNGSTPLYAGLKNGRECWYNLKNFDFVFRKKTESTCDKECEGNHNQTCGGNSGGNGRLSIYDVTLSYCVDPGLVSNGTPAIHHALDQFYFGTIIIVTCDSGFHLQGAPSIQCLLSQPYGVAWNAALPECLDLSTTSKAPMKTDSSITSLKKTGLPSTMPTKMELCGQSNIGAYVGIGGAFTVSIITAVVLIAVCYYKRRGADKSNTNQSPRATANADTGVILYAPNKYEGQSTTSHNNESYAMHTIAGEDGEAKSSYATIPDDVTKRQSGGVGWEDNTLYETSYPTDPEHLEVG